MDHPVVEPAAAKVRTILVNAMHSDDTLRVAKPSLLKVFDLLHPELGECDIAAAPEADSPDPAESVTGKDLTAVVGTPIEAPQPVDAPAPEAQMAVDGKADSAAVDTAVGGVLIEETIVEERAVAPEQMEVVGPQTATGGLPDTGYDGSVLTMLGLAMVASGAAARYVARD